MSDLSASLSSWAWEGIEFPGTDTAAEGGHDSAKHAGYGKRGANVETTGERAKTFTVTIPLRNGIRWPGAERLYPETYQRLRAAFRTAEGLLTHPTWGLLTAHLDSWKERIDPMRPDGLDIEVTWTEQNGEAEGLELTLARSTTPAATAASAAADADAAGAGLSGLADVTSLADEVSAAFDALDAAVQTGPEVARTFEDVIGSVSARLADPAGLSAAGHDYRASLLRTQAALCDARAEYLGDGTTQTVTLREDMSAARAAALAYGDASRAGELVAKNAIDDVLLIPAGTVLVI